MNIAVEIIIRDFYQDKIRPCNEWRRANLFVLFRNLIPKNPSECRASVVQRGVEGLFKFPSHLKFYIY